MNEIGIFLIVFLGLFGFLLSLLYVLFVLPARRRGIQRRLDAITSEGISPDSPVGRSAASAGVKRLDDLLERFAGSGRLQLWVAQSGVEQSAGFVVALAFLLFLGGTVISLGIGIPWILGLTFVGLLTAAPFLVLGFRRYRRLARFETQFPDALDVLSRAVKAGYAVTTGLQVIADEMPDPVSKEFRIAFEQQNLGLPLRDALANMGRRVPLPDVHIFVSTLQIQAESGGNLAEILDKLAMVVRERFRLLRQVRVYSAEGRLTMVFLMLMAPVTAVAFFFINPEYIMRLFEDPLGVRLLIGAIILQGIGYLVIRNIVNIRV